MAVRRLSHCCQTVADWLSAQGHPVTPTTSARDVEPLLAQGIRHGFVADTELAVDNRLVVDALLVSVIGDAAHGHGGCECTSRDSSRSPRLSLAVRR